MGSKMQGALIGALLTLIVGGIGAGLTVWRDSALHASELAHLNRDITRLETAVGKIESWLRQLDERERQAQHYYHGGPEAPVVVGAESALPPKQDKQEPQP